MAPTAIFAALAVALLTGVNANEPHEIVSASLAALGEFPYQVSVRVWRLHKCGGAIVSPRHIVTTAHCLTDLNGPLTVVTGTISTSGGDVYTAAEIKRHPQYSGGTYSAFDIAVITLADAIIFNTIQNESALPTAPTPANIMANITGWGYLNASITTIIPSLTKIKMETISKDQCQEMFGPNIRIYKHQICTYGGFGVCAGESGSPLVVNGELIGVLSWGVPCVDGFPNVFTSVYHLLPWVNSTING